METGNTARSRMSFMFTSMDKQKGKKEGGLGPNSNTDAVQVGYGCHTGKCPQLHLFWGNEWFADGGQNQNKGPGVGMCPVCLKKGKKAERARWC